MKEKVIGVVFSLVLAILPLSDSYAAPADKLSIVDLSVLNENDLAVTTASVTEYLKISIEIRNSGVTEQTFRSIVLVKDSEGYTTELFANKQIVGVLDTHSSVVQWIPGDDGIYNIELFVWDGLENPTPLLPKSSISVIIEDPPVVMTEDLQEPSVKETSPVIVEAVSKDRFVSFHVKASSQSPPLVGFIVMIYGYQHFTEVMATPDNWTPGSVNAYVMGWTTLTHPIMPNSVEEDFAVRVSKSGTYEFRWSAIDPNLKPAASGTLFVNVK